MYCSIEDVRERNEQLLDETYVDDNDIVVSIETAEELVNGYLFNNYRVPFVSVPVLIKNITADIAASDCLLKIVGNRGDNKEPIQARLMKKQAKETLEQIKKNEIVLAGLVKKSNIKSTRSNTVPYFSYWDPYDPDSYQ